MAVINGIDRRMNDTTRMDEPFGAVLGIRIWVESYSGSSTVRARILRADDPVRADIDSVVVSGVQKTAEVISKWLSDYVAECQRQAAGGTGHPRGTQTCNEGFVPPIEADSGNHADSDASRGDPEQH